MVRQGQLEKVARGMYQLPEAEPTRHHSLAEAAKRIPTGAICLLSALRFHELGTQSPHEVWMAVDRKARRPNGGYPPLHIVRFSGDALISGVEAHILDGVCVKITAPARTIADCFKYRTKIGLDVGLEALRAYLDERRGTIDDLWRFAKMNRVTGIMRPYLEALA